MFKKRNKTFIKIWPSMLNQDPVFIVEHDDDGASIADEHISDSIVYYSVDSVEGLYTNSFDQALNEYPNMLHAKLKNIRTDLRRKHSNYVSCELSSVKSSGFEHDKLGTMRKEQTIAIYCRIKGYIPWNEEKFPSEIHGYKTDIRPGFTFLCTTISSGMDVYALDVPFYGTLGPFFENPKTKDVYALSAAHCFFTPDVFARKLKENNQQIQNFEFDFCPEKATKFVSICKPTNEQLTFHEPMEVDEDYDTPMDVDQSVIGYVERVVFRAGKEESNDGIIHCGIDICTIKIKQDIQLHGNFPGPLPEGITQEYGR